MNQTPKKRSPKEKELFEGLQPLVRQEGTELIDVRLVREQGRLILRLVIDKAGGVGLDDCEAVSHRCDAWLDEQGVTTHDYFEVQSPGLDKPLETETDFRLHCGEWMEIKNYQKIDGRKEWRARLIDFDEEGLTLQTPDGTTEKVPFQMIAQVKRSLYQEGADHEQGIN